MIPHLKKDESEWNFYDQLVKDWNSKHKGQKPLSEFLKFMLNEVELSLKVQ
jgi:hypothetical protein